MPIKVILTDIFWLKKIILGIKLKMNNLVK